jgi:hypothetical protein
MREQNRSSRTLLHVCFLLFVFASARANAKAPDWLTILKSPSDNFVGSSCVGHSGPSKFYLAAKDLISKKTNLAHYQTLLQNADPVIRVLGAYCIILTQDAPAQYLGPLLEDKAVVLYMPYGCFAYDMEVQKVVRKLLIKPTLLDCDGSEPVGQ